MSPYPEIGSQYPQIDWTRESMDTQGIPARTAVQNVGLYQSRNPDPVAPNKYRISDFIREEKSGLGCGRTDVFGDRQ